MQTQPFDPKSIEVEEFEVADPQHLAMPVTVVLVTSKTSLVTITFGVEDEGAGDSPDGRPGL
jgi:hypothetical protein